MQYGLGNDLIIGDGSLSVDFASGTDYNATTFSAINECSIANVVHLKTNLKWYKRLWNIIKLQFTYIFKGEIKL